MSNEHSQDAGTSADALDTSTIETTETPETEEGAKKGKSGIPKILAAKNEAERKVAELEAKVADLEKRTYTDEEFEAQSIRIAERNQVFSMLEEDQIEAFNAMQEEYKDLSPKQIAKLMDIKIEPSKPNNMSIPGYTPASMKKAKGIEDKSREDLYRDAKKELQDMLG